MNIIRISHERAAIYLLVLGSMLVVTAFGEENLSSRLPQCAAVEDDAQRLECFDNEVSRHQQIVILEEKPEIPQAKSTELQSPASSPDVPIAVPAKTTIDNFGMNPKLASQSANGDIPAEITEITAMVTEVYERPYGEYVVTLDNGQVWTEKEHKAGLRIKEGDTLIIRKGRFGGYRLIGGGNRSSQVVRVK